MDYKLIIDTREHLPLPFRKNKETRKLHAGDYAAELNGLLLPVVFDRKSPADAMQTLMKGHARFTRELGVAHQLQQKLIMIVECSYTNFVTKQFDGGRHSKIRPDILTKILHSTMLSHNLEVVFCKDRSEMVKYIRNYFNALVTYELKHNEEKY